MAPTKNTKILTKDSYDLAQVMADGFELFNVYNDDVERPFRDLFTRQVSDRIFSTDLYGEMPWDEIGEGEHLGTGDAERFWDTMTVHEFGRALGWNRQYVERHTREELVEMIQKLVEGYDEMEHERIMVHLFNSAADGTELWFDVPSKGAYDFSREHDHTFGTTGELFDDDPFADTGAYTEGEAHSVVEHLHAANAHLRHHKKDPRITLISSQLKRIIVNEMSWDASYHFPEANGLRGTSLDDVDVVIDGTPLVETEWLNDLGGTGYTFYTVAGDGPIAMNQEVAPEMVRDETGAPLIRPDHMFTAHGYARFGLKTVDPTSIVKVTADSIA